MNLPILANPIHASLNDSEAVVHLEANGGASTHSRIVVRNVRDDIRDTTQSTQTTTQTTQTTQTTTYNQSRIVERDIQDTTFGDLLMEKKEDTFRIGFQNFNGLTGKLDDTVDRSLRDWITDNSFDVFGISEVNMYWPRVKKELQFDARLSNWWQPGQFRSKHAFNSTEKQIKWSIRQYGGTAQISVGDALIRELERDEDTRGLGRWVWQKYRGKNNKLL